jgi:hypothetical protein
VQEFRMRIMIDCSGRPIPKKAEEIFAHRHCRE